MDVPNNGVGVEVFSGIKPKMELLFSAPYSLRVDISTESVGIPGCVSKKLQVNLIVMVSWRW